MGELGFVTGPSKELWAQNPESGSQWHGLTSPPLPTCLSKSKEGRKDSLTWRILIPGYPWILSPSLWNPRELWSLSPLKKCLSFKKSPLLFVFGEEIIKRSENDLRQVQIIIFTNFSTHTNIWGLARFNWPHFELMIIISNKRSSWCGNPKRRLLWACSTSFPQEWVHTFSSLLKPYTDHPSMPSP